MAHQIGVVAAAASGANSLALSEDEERGGKKPSLGIAKGREEGIMLCNKRGNDWSKLTAQLATYPLVKCPLLLHASVRHR